MAKHKDSVMQAALAGVKPSRDTIILPFDVYNITKKRAKEYEKYKNDIVSV